jgi:hypothetical protein
MKKYQDFGLRTTTDLKVFLLFLLDNIRSPIDEETLLYIVEENTDDITLDYTACLIELVASGHLYFDEVDKIKYYMISEKGRMVASELYDTLDKEFREKSLRSAIKHMSLSNSGTKIFTKIEETENRRFRVSMQAQDADGEVMSVSLVVPSRQEAELIKKNFESKPDGVYRGVFFASTGRIEYAL